MQSTLDAEIEKLWKEALSSWNYPSIPDIIVPKNEEDIANLGEMGEVLAEQLAFMDLATFQTYANLEKVAKLFGDDLARGLKAIFKHEQGHRFCPYDAITSMLMVNSAKKGLEEMSATPYKKSALASTSRLAFNLFADTTVNTTLARNGDEDIEWLYRHILQDKADSKIGHVYGRSMELAWGMKLLPEGTIVSEEECDAAEKLAKLFDENVLDKSLWKDNIRIYARIIGKFIEEDKKSEKPCFDDITSNLPQKLGREILEELARKLARPGNKPGEDSGFKEFKELLAGVGKGDTKFANKAFYEALSRSYNVEFETKPASHTRTSPFQPEKWQPSMGIHRLDIDYSTQVGGKLIPGVTTYTWKNRKREQKGLENTILDFDIYIDASGTMTDPSNALSLGVLAGLVAARKAHKKGAKIRATVFSGDAQSSTQEWTRDLNAIYERLIIYHNGGTTFPVKQLLNSSEPKQVLIITDAALDNKEETSNAIKKLLKNNPMNKVTVYAISASDTDYLKKAGAQVIRGTNIDIFKEVIGSSKSYSR